MSSYDELSDELMEAFSELDIAEIAASSQRATPPYAPPHPTSPNPAGRSSTSTPPPAAR